MSKLAQQLIAENKRTRSPHLDLGNCGLRDLPPELAELIWLESLTLASEWNEWVGQQWQYQQSQNRGQRNKGLADIRSVRQLTGLRSLVLSGTSIADLSPLAELSSLTVLDVVDTQVSDLSPLAGLSNLTNLNVSNTKVADLSPLAGLSALTKIQIRGTKVADLSPLAGLSALTTLYVPQTQVADLSPLTGLSALTTLDVSQTQVADLSPLAGLSTLTTLNVWDTKVSDLSPLAGLSTLTRLDVSYTLVADLSPLTGLSALTTLEASYTQVSDLSPLAGLLALTTLDVSGTQVSDLSPLAGLSALTVLLIGRSQVSDLSPLAGLLALTKLNVSETQVSDLSPLAALSGLTKLDISNTKVADLSPLEQLIAGGCPVEWSDQPYRGPGIYLLDCPLTNPPPEIAKQGNEAILNYFREKAAGPVDHLYEAKMLILGEGGAGKTSLLRRLYQPERPLPAEQETTKGIDIYPHTFTCKNGKPFRLNVWDFGGQEIYHATHQFFLTRRSLYLLVDDTRKDHKNVSDEGFKYWLDLVDVFGGHSPVLIFQNEKGGRSKQIDVAGIKGRFDNVKDRQAGNLEHADAADKLREAIEHFAANLSHIGETLPAKWINIRADLETRANAVPYISQQEYFDIYTRHLPFDRTKALHLSQYLHDLGVFLHFQDDPLLARTVILQNPWATAAVFRVLDDEAVKAKCGRFSQADFVRLWHEPHYADMHLELLGLMKRFELCYELPDTQPQTWLAPQLLQPSKPLHATTQPGDKPANELVLRYRYDFLPKGLVSRLTVRLHRFVREPEMAWTSGVLFERNRTKVLVQLLPTGREIELRAQGPEAKELLSVVAADLDALNDSFPGLRDKVDQFIPCHCPNCLQASEPENQPHFFSYRDLIRRKEHSRLKVECPLSYKDVEVLALLDGIRVEHLPGWGKPTPELRVIRIFLASSSELREDRDKFDLYFRQQNDRLRKQGLYLEIVRWENFLDAMSDTRLQDEYNQAIRNCDIFVSLFATKAGKFTAEEFEVAFEHFKATKQPRIYTYFKDVTVKLSSIRQEDFQSLWAFQKRVKDLGHFHTSYESTEHLNRHFRDQLDRLRDSNF